ncbi:MAG: HAD hydrolase-like protein [Alphaproteobacteria bacterium]
MKIFDNLLEISDNFDVFVFDANGVLWSGDNFFDGTLELLEKFMKNGKIVYILSNSTFRSKFTVDRYEQYGLKQGIHYTKIMTNGEIVHDFLMKGLLKFETKGDPKTYYNLFFPNNELFEGTKYKKVNDISKADFVYIGIPRIHSSQTDIVENFKSEISNFGENAKTFFDNGDDIWYDCISVKPFMETINQVKKLGIPALNINPDFTAKENGKFVTRQGTIADHLKKSGIEVVQFGKPLKITFENALSEVKDIAKDKILMIGDAIPNDIKGANNFGIKSALTVETGVTANEIFTNNQIDMEKLEYLLKKYDATCDFLIKRVSQKKY